MIRELSEWEEVVNLWNSNKEDIIALKLKVLNECILVFERAKKEEVLLEMLKKKLNEITISLIFCVKYKSKRM